jgi:hypothetical protein
VAFRVLHPFDGSSDQAPPEPESEDCHDEDGAGFDDRVGEAADQVGKIGVVGHPLDQPTHESLVAIAWWGLRED